MKRIFRLALLLVLLITSIQYLAYSNVLDKSESDIKVTIIYDNYDFKDGLKSDWGFSCLIEFPDKTILFDTGARPGVFEKNLKALNIDPQSIDMVVVSHDHYDHTGGLSTFLELNNKVPVYILKSFSDKTKEIITENNAKIVCEHELTEISKNVFLSGELQGKIEEQSLAINTDKGLVVITGCSHPGINKILEHFKSSLNKDIYMVFGGFHLMRMNDEEIEQIITKMRSLGVQKCGATHCTGKKQIKQFKNAFGKNYVQMGVGNVVEF
ncbi:MAG: MBL fold metallo-hydrolase [Bacteroidetes bacterium]|nr:MBL fold metallo-hydrolase [Bacteroidota bacterium]